MYPVRSTHLFYLLILSWLAALPSTAMGGEHYDISYLWHQEAESVEKYRSQVAKTLGPNMAKRLKIVTRDGLYGLIYHRNGDNAGAQKVARSHSKILLSRGLEAASVVPAEEWTDYTGVPVTSQTKESTKVAAVSRSKMSSPERLEEIRQLEVAVEDYIKRLRREGKIARDERTGWAVYDFTTGEKLVTINENIQFQAASLIKPFIAAAFFSPGGAG
jgi:beta-lactamase class A